MSPAEKAAREEMAERKMQEKLDKAYSKSLTNTEYPDQMGRPADKMGRPADQMGRPADQMGKPKKDPRDAVRGQKGYAKGGYVRAADGIAKRGKTRGKMC
jgi:hypothetical protein